MHQRVQDQRYERPFDLAAEHGIAPRLEQSLGRQLGQQLISAANRFFETLDQLCLGSRTALGEFLVSVAPIWLTANQRQDALVDVPFQMQQQIGDAVEIFAGPMPELLLAKLVDAVTNLRGALAELIARLIEKR